MSWWSEFFDDDYAAYGLALTKPELVAQMCDFVVRALQIEPGAFIFDQCCGIGRLSLPLAERGFQVIGVDQSRSYIAVAQREAASRNLPCEFHIADAGEFVIPTPCDGAFNWFTSFGYHDDDAMNIRPLQRAYESLKPGGRFVLDYLNVPRVFGEFRPWFIDRPNDPSLKGLIVLQESKPDFMRGIIDGTWTFLHADGRRTVRSVSTRMYMPHEIVAMLRRCGFENIQLLGGYDDEEFNRASRRLIAVSRKPA